MILSKEQVIENVNEMEKSRRRNAESGTVQRLSNDSIQSKLEDYATYPKHELRAEMKRRKERLRYARIMANPKTRSEYRARKRAEYAKRA